MQQQHISEKFTFNERPQHKIISNFVMLGKAHSGVQFAGQDEIWQIVKDILIDIHI